MLLIFLLCAFRSGTDRYYLKKVSGEEAKGRDVLFYFKPVNALWLIRFYLNLWVRRLAVISLCFFPSVCVLACLLYYVSYGRASLTVSLILFFAVLVFAVNGLIWFIKMNSFFFLARYSFVSDDFNSMKRIFAFSIKKIEGERHRVFLKKLSLMPWILSCVLVYPAFFVRSYYRESMAEIACELMRKEYLQN